MNNANPNTPIYSIGAVNEKTGLTRRQIRYYEEVDLIKPARTEGNQRIYSQNDIARLNKIKELLESGLNIAGIKKQLGTAEEEQKKRESSNKKSLSSGRKVSQKKLTSLYPVSNRADLIELLNEEEFEE
ncbi:MerR family transcriptional regulator [Fuchsiella alkaliacetigena]|uniref:MerR family transcriptional regulator n=1 Tax=Fuchsiella alkaliacetigena TaxID=957042 RepID=UPI00200ADA20|nr:MerR family transcriptional regulator [Fuchsiella alkaliacetigena]MCK8824919.1 helix-turn-helix domain-containing protein [Fuchsiella alkaliacetigena]